MAERFIYQLITDPKEFRDSEAITNWAFNPYGQCYDIDERTRKHAIDKLEIFLPKSCFIINGEEIVYTGSVKECAEDYADQLFDHALDVRHGGFTGTVMTTYQALHTLYHCDSLFFVGYDKLNPVTLPGLLTYLERAKYGRTVFRFGSITLVED